MAKFTRNKYKAIIWDNDSACPGRKKLAEIVRLYNGKGEIIIATPLRLMETLLDKMHVQEFFEEDFKNILSKYFEGDIGIIKGHPVVLVEFHNRNFLFRKLFNLLYWLVGYNPFSNGSNWKYHGILTAVIEETILKATVKL
ncbi:hypothetical protein ACFLT8_05640 [Chloroflexota bacterium]